MNARDAAMLRFAWLNQANQRGATDLMVLPGKNGGPERVILRVLLNFPDGTKQMTPIGTLFTSSLAELEASQYDEEHA